MSQYMNFYMKVSDKYVLIASYSRNTDFYGIFDDTLNIPYGSVNFYNAIDFQEVLDYAKDKINNYKKMLFEYDDKIQILKTMEGSVKDRLEEIDNLLFEKKNAEEEISESIGNLENIVGFCSTVIRIFAENNHPWSVESIVDVDNLFCIGIECGNPNNSTENS